MKCVLCLNVGSSSLKFATYEGDRRASEGTIENIGLPGSQADYRSAVEAIFSSLKCRPDAVGHRLVHGGPEYFDPVLLDRKVIDRLRGFIPFAPLHLPRELEVVDAVARLFPNLPQIGCFDTAFHRHLPALARRFALPWELGNEGVVRYGFHGLSFTSIVTQLGDAIPERVVIAHMGNGVSLAAVRNGQCVDTTMGFTPTGGVMMGSRSGDLDPGIFLYLLRKGYTVDGLEKLFNDESGLLGVSGISSDMRVLLERPEGEEAIAMFCYQVRKGVGALAAALDGVDLLVFTGGIGERAERVREQVCSGLRHLNIPSIRVMHTDEDGVIARHTREVLA